MCVFSVPAKQIVKTNSQKLVYCWWWFFAHCGSFSICRRSSNHPLRPSNNGLFWPNQHCVWVDCGDPCHKSFKCFGQDFANENGNLSTKLNSANMPLVLFSYCWTRRLSMAYRCQYLDIHFMIPLIISVKLLQATNISAATHLFNFIKLMAKHILSFIHGGRVLCLYLQCKYQWMRWYVIRLSNQPTAGREFEWFMIYIKKRFMIYLHSVTTNKF